MNYLIVYITLAQLSYIFIVFPCCSKNKGNNIKLLKLTYVLLFIDLFIVI